MPVRTGPPETAGRWALLPERDADPTRRAHARAEHLLERHGVVTRGAVVSERIAGGFAGGLQGALAPSRTPAAAAAATSSRASGRRSSAAPVRSTGCARSPSPTARPGTKPTVGRARRDRPRQPFGAALPWPDAGDPERAGHRPGRKAGALVVLVDGALTVYVERGGRTLLTWNDDLDVLTPALRALADAARRGALGRLTVEKADGEALLGSGGATPAALALDGGRLPGDTEGVEAACLRETPSTARQPSSTAPSPVTG